MHIQLHELIERNDELVWESVDLTCESSLKIINDPKRNGFTGAGLGALLPPVPAAADPIRAEALSSGGVSCPRGTNSPNASPPGPPVP
ncbi:hypothetical protein ACFQX6_46835 [Streptosporangium lutulentum]